jgi:hypothetical protein
MTMRGGDGWPVSVNVPAPAELRVALEPLLFDSVEVEPDPRAVSVRSLDESTRALLVAANPTPLRTRLFLGLRTLRRRT